MTTIHSDDSELAAAVRDMTSELSGLRRDAQELRDYSQRNRRLIKITAVSLVIDVLMSLGLAYAVYRSQEASDRAEAAASATVVTCRSSNEARALQTNLWNFILALPPGPDETPEQRAQRAETVGKFKVYIGDAFAPRDCDRLLKGTP